MDMVRADANLGTHEGQNVEDRKHRTGLMRKVAGIRKATFKPLFLITVILPTIAAILYYGFFASDVFVSESRFIVRSPEKQSASGLGMLLQSSGFGSTGDEIYAAQDFVQSRDALKALNKDDAFARAYSRETISIFDRFNPLGINDTFEDLYGYYQDRISVDQDSASSIVALTVRAYAPQDAYRLNERLLDMAEATVNRLNERGRQDLIRYAQREVQEAKSDAQSTALALASYRNQAGIVDPEQQATVQLQMISKLQDELIATRTRLREVRAYAPDNPQVAVLDERTRSLASEIDEQSQLVAGSSRSLSSRAARYQRLWLENQFADKQLASAMASLEEARNEARRKQSYVERIVSPNLPDEALEPRRLRGIFSTLVLGLAAWGIISMLIAGMMEHRD